LIRLARVLMSAAASMWSHDRNIRDARMSRGCEKRPGAAVAGVQGLEVGLVTSETDTNKRAVSEECRALGAGLLGGLNRRADGPTAPGAEAVTKLNFVQVGHAY
jgi:hypothetical protein